MNFKLFSDRITQVIYFQTNKFVKSFFVIIVFILKIFILLSFCDNLSGDKQLNDQVKPPGISED